jgi:hypothetical protein
MAANTPLKVKGCRHCAVAVREVEGLNDYIVNLLSASVSRAELLPARVARGR